MASQMEYLKSPFFFYNCYFMPLSFFFFFNLKNCISFAKHQNESATGIHVLLFKDLFCGEIMSHPRVWPAASPMAQQVKNPPAMQETPDTQFQSLGQEDPLEEEMATHFSVLAWRIQWMEEPGGLQSMGSQSQTRLSTHIAHKAAETRTQPVS